MWHLFTAACAAFVGIAGLTWAIYPLIYGIYQAWKHRNDPLHICTTQCDHNTRSTP